MSNKATHTWDLVVRYHRCPYCGFINESRKRYEYRNGEYVKEMACGRCGKEFVEKKVSKHKFWPLFGKEQPAEMDWS